MAIRHQTGKRPFLLVTLAGILVVALIVVGVSDAIDDDAGGQPMPTVTGDSVGSGVAALADGDAGDAISSQARPALVRRLLEVIRRNALLHPPLGWGLPSQLGRPSAGELGSARLSEAAAGLWAGGGKVSLLYLS